MNLNMSDEELIALGIIVWVLYLVLPIIGTYSLLWTIIGKWTIIPALTVALIYTGVLLG